VAQYAGSTFSLTVNLVAQFYNRVLPGSNSTFKLSSDDPNHKLGAFGNFNTVNGQFITTHTYLVTQSTAAGWTITASTATGDAVLPDESARFRVYPSTAAKLVIVLPGQARADGVGMSGNPNTQIAGENIVLTVYAVDAGWNYVPVDQRNLRLRTFTDPFVQSSWTVSMANGVALATVSLRAVGVHSLTIDDQSGVPPGLAGVTSSTFTLVASNPKKLRVLLPNQAGVSGSTTTGRSGIPIDQNAGTTVTVTLQVTDTFWNLTPGASQQIRIVATDPYALITPSTLTVVGQALIAVIFRRSALNYVRAEMLYQNPPWGDILDKDTSTVVSVLAGTPKKLLAILPGEEFDVGASNGKKGSPNITAKAGESFYATVAVVDQYFNVVTGRATNVRIKSPPGFPFAVSAPSAAINIAFGMTDAQALPVTLVAAATWHQVVPEEDPSSGLSSSDFSSTFTITAANPKGLQVLLPGEFNAPGAGIYPNGGKTGSPLTRTAGKSFQITVNLDDNYNNIAPAAAGPNDYFKTTDDYDNEPTTASLGGGSRVFNFDGMVTKTTAAVIAVHPRIWLDAVNQDPDSKVCTANPSGDPLLNKN
ncbi:MAG: hypothetical protein AAB578_09125, partial [Elusimicrobiota bacterium]